MSIELHSFSTHKVHSFSPRLHNLRGVGKMKPAETEVARNEGVSCVQFYSTIKRHGL